MLNLEKRNPSTLWPSLNSDFDSLFQDLWKPFDNGLTKAAIDVYEESNNIVVKGDMPGLSKEDIQISLEDDTLCISSVQKEEKESKDKHYFHRERVQRSFARNIYVGHDIDSEQIKASYKDGVLQVTLPKAGKKENKSKITIE